MVYLKAPSTICVSNQILLKESPLLKFRNTFETSSIQDLKEYYLKLFNLNISIHVTIWITLAHLSLKRQIHKASSPIPSAEPEK